MQLDNMIAMENNIRLVPPHNQQDNDNPVDGQAGTAATMRQIRRKLTDGRIIALWEKADMEALLIRKGAEVMLADSETPLSDGLYQLEDGSKLLIARGKVKHFDRRYLNLREVVIAGILGLVLIFLIYAIKSGGL